MDTTIFLRHLQRDPFPVTSPVPLTLDKHIHSAPPSRQEGSVPLRLNRGTAKPYRFEKSNVFPESVRVVPDAPWRRKVIQESVHLKAGGVPLQSTGGGGGLARATRRSSPHGPTLGVLKWLDLRRGWGGAQRPIPAFNWTISRDIDSFPTLNFISCCQSTSFFRTLVGPYILLFCC